MIGDGRIWGSGLRIHRPPKGDRIWGIWGSYPNIPRAKLFLLKRDSWVRVWGLGEMREPSGRKSFGDPKA